MKAKVYKCDICGTDQTQFDVLYSFKVKQSYIHRGLNSSDKYDLCQHCYHKMICYLRGEKE